MPKSGIYGFSGPFRWLSNFAPCDILYKGILYPTTENAYQAAKFLDESIRVQFIGISPGNAKSLGRLWKDCIRSDWTEVNLSIMKEINQQKYYQEPYETLLLNTVGLYIEETNTWGDTFWGVCVGKGKNHLGLILMEIRDELVATRP